MRMEADDFDSGGDHSAPEDCGAEEDMLLGCETDSPRTQLIKANIRQVGQGGTGRGAGRVVDMRPGGSYGGTGGGATDRPQVCQLAELPPPAPCLLLRSSPSPFRTA